MMYWNEVLRVLSAVVMLTDTAAFTLPGATLIRNEREDIVRVRITRNSGRASHGFPHNSVRHDSRGKQLASIQELNPQQGGYKEVKSSDELTSDPVTSNIYQVKFIDNRRVARAEKTFTLEDENNIGHQSQALSQEVSKSDLVNTVPKMVVIVSTTIAALFGMCVMAAIFQCCCRNKRSTSDSDNGDVVKVEKEEKARRSRSKSPSPVKEPTKAPEPEEKTENDKLLEDDDLGDFSVVQRETAILKSYRKPPPPKNRARASRVPRMKAAAPSKDTKEEGFSLIKEDGDSIKSKSGSQRSSPEKGVVEDVVPKDIAKETPRETSTEDRRLSFESAKQLVDSMLAEVKEKEAARSAAEKLEDSVKQAPKEERVMSKSVNGLNAKPDNIFMQIDPTVRIEDPNERKSRIPVKTSPPSSPESQSHLRPNSANKDQRKFLVPSVHGDQMDQLVKSLKSKLKAWPATKSILRPLKRIWIRRVESGLIQIQQGTLWVSKEHMSRCQNPRHRFEEN